MSANNTNMKKITCLFLVCCLLVMVSSAQQKRALLIGIDTYSGPDNYDPKVLKPELKSLYGCKNDALAMQSVITSKFEFSNSNIKLLLDQKATNQAILSSMDTLLKESKAGDIAFIFYAGHGSEVTNSLSRDERKIDQAIVPADRWKDEVHYIRDKQLSYYFNEFVKKKVKLTVIFDCCHSGSISRGPNPVQTRSRFADPEPQYDAKDPSTYPAPERISDDFLIFSAAQHDELALEEDDYLGQPHGAFTAAFLRAFSQQSVDASALNLFLSVRAIIKAKGKTQEPVIGGSPLRQSQTLFGIAPGKLSDRTLVPVLDTNLNGRIAVQAGFGIGLLKGSELCILNGKNDTLFKLLIDTVTGITRAIGKVVKGDANQIKPGAMFAVTYWAPELKPLLNIYIPRSTLSDEEVNKFLKVANELKDETVSHMKAIDMNVAGGGNIQDPYLSVFWQNNKCYVKVDNQKPVEITEITTKNILNNRAQKDSTIYIEIPVSQKNSEQWYKQLSDNHNLNLVDDPLKAQYVLFGKPGLNGFPAYGFRKADFAVRDSLQPMPLVTDCFEIAKAGSVNPRDISGALKEMAQKLYKINRWLNMSVTAVNSEQLPYIMKFADRKNNQTITGGRYFVGDRIYRVMTRNKNFKGSKSETGDRYVYLFTIDQNGKMQLLFPNATGNDSNRITIPANMNLAKETIVADPFWDLEITGTGTDTYFLLMCNEPIGDAGNVFSAEAVNSEATSRGASNPNPMSELLDMDAPSGTSARGQKFNSSFTLQRISFLSTRRK